MKNRRTLALLAPLLMIGTAARAQGNEKSDVIAIRAARLLDVRAGRYIVNPVVVVRGERIVSVTPDGQPPKGARLIDLGDATLLPACPPRRCHGARGSRSRNHDGA